MSVDTRVHILRDGRELSYCIAGDENGEPFFTFHGLPGSRMESMLLDVAGKRLNVKIITPDRPGYGFSSAQPGHTLLDWSDDVAHLADALGIQQFSVIGISGGAPCALSCAYYLAKRIQKTAIVCPLGPLYSTGLSDHLRWFVSLGFYLARRFPGVLNILYGVPVLLLAKFSPALLLNIIALVHGGVDRRVLKQPEARYILKKNIQEAFRQGTKGALQDMQIYSRDWGFDLTDIHSHINIWHGNVDDIVPLAHSRYIHGQLPDSALIVMQDQAHFSLPITCIETILATMASKQ